MYTKRCLQDPSVPAFIAPLRFCTHLQPIHTSMFFLCTFGLLYWLPLHLYTSPLAATACSTLSPGSHCTLTAEPLCISVGCHYSLILLDWLPLHPCTSPLVASAPSYTSTSCHCILVCLDFLPLFPHTLPMAGVASLYFVTGCRCTLVHLHRLQLHPCAYSLTATASLYVSTGCHYTLVLLDATAPLYISTFCHYTLIHLHWLPVHPRASPLSATAPLDFCTGCHCILTSSPLAVTCLLYPKSSPVGATALHHTSPLAALHPHAPPLADVAPSYFSTSCRCTLVLLHWLPLHPRNIY